MKKYTTPIVIGIMIVGFIVTILAIMASIGKPKVTEYVPVVPYTIGGQNYTVNEFCPDGKTHKSEISSDGKDIVEFNCPKVEGKG